MAAVAVPRCTMLLRRPPADASRPCFRTPHTAAPQCLSVPACTGPSAIRASATPACRKCEGDGWYTLGRRVACGAASAAVGDRHVDEGLSPRGKNVRIKPRAVMVIARSAVREVEGALPSPSSGGVLVPLPGARALARSGRTRCSPLLCASRRGCAVIRRRRTYTPRAPRTLPSAISVQTSTEHLDAGGDGFHTAAVCGRRLLRRQWTAAQL